MMTSSRTSLVIATSHPIQYQAPWFRALARERTLELTVLFGTIPSPSEQGRGFGVSFSWDIPLLDGYDWRAIDGEVPGDRRFSSIAAAFRAIDPDVVLVTGWQNAFLRHAAVAGKVSGRVVLARGESNELRARPLLTRLAHRAWLRVFDGFLTIGRANRDFYRARGRPDEFLFPCPYFVDNDRIAGAVVEARSSRERQRTAWGFSSTTSVALFCGKLIRKKRPQDFVRAIGTAVEAGSEIGGVVAGDGELRPQLEAVVRDAQLPVVFVGFKNQSELPRVYAACDCLVLPSDYGETWGLVVNEAMVAGMPAIVSDRVGCGPDLVTDGQTGLTFRFGDVGELSDHLRRLCDTELRDRLGAAARRRVMSDYSVAQAVQGTLDAIRTCRDRVEVGRGRSPGHAT